MHDFITIFFAIVGFSATFFGLFFGTFWVMDKISAATRLRDRRHNELLSRLDAIERNHRNKPSAG
jgi:hypothetical protein